MFSGSFSLAYSGPHKDNSYLSAVPLGRLNPVRRQVTPFGAEVVIFSIRGYAFTACLSLPMPPAHMPWHARQ